MATIRAYLRQHHVGLLALALMVGGGTAYAAGALPKNSVTSTQIKNGSVASKDLKDKGIKPQDLKPGYAPFAAAFGGTTVNTSSQTPAKLPGAKVVVTMASPGTIEATFSGTSNCGNSTPTLTFCRVTLVVDGVAMDGEVNDVFDSGFESAEALADHHTVVRTTAVSKGSHTVEVVWDTQYGGGTGQFTLHNWNLLAEGHLS